MQELEHAIRRHIDTVNANPRPFRWTKSDDDVAPAESILRGAVTRRLRIKKTTFGQTQIRLNRKDGKLSDTSPRLLL